MLNQADAQLSLTRVTQNRPVSSDVLTDKEGTAVLTISREGLYRVVVDRPGYAQMEYEVTVTRNRGILLVANMDRVTFPMVVAVTDPKIVHETKRVRTVTIEAHDQATGAPLSNARVRTEFVRP